uniref:Uncharacterized protein n=1 Tax=Oryza rufipogon TaxID=4529 RepID=A0A0E0RD42_ORYRU
MGMGQCGREDERNHGVTWWSRRLLRGRVVVMDVFKLFIDVETGRNVELVLPSATAAVPHSVEAAVVGFAGRVQAHLGTYDVQGL